jgi:hypothetical protein
VGLLLPHKRKLRLWNDCLSVSPDCDFERSGGGLRGDVKNFSKDSRYRLFKLLHQLSFEKVTFITLTYPLDFPTDKKIYKAHLKEWRRRIEHAYGKKQCIWRLEFQKRGAPHYHLLYLDFGFVHVQVLCNLWHSITHSTSEAHRRNGVDIKLCTNGKQGALIASYLAKYVAKPDERKQIDVKEKPGRWWGKWNIEESEPVEIEMQDYQAAQVVKKMLDGRKDKRWEPMDPSICTVMGDTMGNNLFKNRVLQIIANGLQ